MRALRLTGTALALSVVVGALVAMVVPASTSTVSAAPVITEYPVTPYPYGITAGPDGALWYTSGVSNHIARATTSGAVTVYTLPDPHVASSITVGPDGALWFTLGAFNSASAGLIGRITTSGAVTEYPLAGTLTPVEITAGPDGALWFTGVVGSTDGGFIGRITTSGIITEYPYPSAYPDLGGIVSGPDNALWFTEGAGNVNSTGAAIGRITTSGIISRYPISTAFGSFLNPLEIVVGPDGALWFTDAGTDKIGRISTDGTINEFATHATTPIIQPEGIVAGPDGALWFTDYVYGQIGRMTTGGVTTFYPVPTGQGNPYVSSPRYITEGPDHALWFTEYTAGKLGRITLEPALSPPANLTAHSPAQYPSLSWDAASGAVSYNIYLNGMKISSTTATTYTDSAAPEGTASYYVTAVDAGGIESQPSNTVTVLVDRTPPTITATVSPTPNSSNWNNSAVTITFTCTDAGSRIQSCSPPQTETTDGSYTVTGTATDYAGNTASINSTVKLDQTPPMITSMVSPAPNSAGWNNSPATVTYTCSDTGSGIQSCSPPQTESTDGIYTLTGTANDTAGNSASVSITIQLDQTPPILGTPSWTANPVPMTQSTSITVPVTDNLSGVASGEYYLGTTDPGQGKGTPMTLSNGTLSATFGADTLSPGIYQVNVRTEDIAGNWSLVTTDYLVVYDASNSGVEGQSDHVLPVYGTDVLPGLVQSSQTDAANLALHVRYANSFLDPSSRVHFAYSTGSQCNNPSKATNCHSMTVDSTSIDWLVISGTNNSQATTQGTASVTIDGTTTTNPFRVVATDGNLLAPATSDTFELQIFAAGANPNTASPLYLLSEPLTGGNVVVKG